MDFMSLYVPFSLLFFSVFHYIFLIFFSGFHFSGWFWPFFSATSRAIVSFTRFLLSTWHSTSYITNLSPLYVCFAHFMKKCVFCFGITKLKTCITACDGRYKCSKRIQCDSKASDKENFPVLYTYFCFSFCATIFIITHTHTLSFAHSNYSSSTSSCSCSATIYCQPNVTHFMKYCVRFNETSTIARKSNCEKCVTNGMGREWHTSDKQTLVRGLCVCVIWFNKTHKIEECQYTKTDKLFI